MSKSLTRSLSLSKSYVHSLSNYVGKTTLHTVTNEIICDVINIFLQSQNGSSMNDFDCCKNLNLEDLTYMGLAVVSREVLREQSLKILNLIMKQQKTPTDIRLSKDDDSDTSESTKNSSIMNIGSKYAKRFTDVISFINSLTRPLFDEKPYLKSTIIHKSTCVNKNVAPSVRHISSFNLYEKHCFTDVQKEQYDFEEYTQYLPTNENVNFSSLPNCHNYSNRVSENNDSSLPIFDIGVPKHIEKKFDFLTHQETFLLPTKSLRQGIVDSVIYFYYKSLDSIRYLYFENQCLCYSNSVKLLQSFTIQNKNISVGWIQLYENFVPILFEKYFNISAFNLTNCIIHTLLSDNACHKSSSSILPSFSIVNEKKINHKIQRHLMLIKSEISYYFTTIRYLTIANISISLRPRFALLFKPCVITNVITFTKHITRETKSCNVMSSTRSISLSSIVNDDTSSKINQYTRTSIILHAIEENIVNSKGEVSKFDVNEMSMGISLTNEIEKDSRLELFKSCCDAWFQYDSPGIRVQNTFFDFLIDSWLSSLEETIKNDKKSDEPINIFTHNYMQHFELNSSCSLKLVKNVNIEIQSSLTNDIMKIPQIVINFEEIKTCDPLHKLKADLVLLDRSLHSLNKFEIVNNTYLYNIVHFVEMIMIRWSQDAMLYEEVFPLLLRIFKKLKKVLTFLTKHLHSMRLEEICDVCIKDISLASQLKNSPLGMLLVLKSVFHNVNEFGKHIYPDRLFRGRVTYSLFKLYRYFENSESKLPKELKRHISLEFSSSSEDVHSIFNCQDIDRRIKCIEDKSNCVFKVEQESSSESQKHVKVSSQSTNRNARMQSVIYMLMKYLGNRRGRIKCSNLNEESIHLQYEKLSWSDFKYI